MHLTFLCSNFFLLIKKNHATFPAFNGTNFIKVGIFLCYWNFASNNILQTQFNSMSFTVETCWEIVTSIVTDSLLLTVNQFGLKLRAIMKEVIWCTRCITEWILSEYALIKFTSYIRCLNLLGITFEVFIRNTFLIVSKKSILYQMY